MKPDFKTIALVGKYNSPASASSLSRLANYLQAKGYTVLVTCHIAETCAISYTPVRIIGRQVFGLTGLSPQDVACIGFQSADFFRINHVEWTAGDPETAAARLRAGNGVIVADRFLTAKNIGMGDTLTLGLGRVEREFEIVGVVSAPGLDVAMQSLGMRSNYTDFAISCVFLDFDIVAELFDNRDAYVLHHLVTIQRLRRRNRQLGAPERMHEPGQRHFHALILASDENPALTEPGRSPTLRRCVTAR